MYFFPLRFWLPVSWEDVSTLPKCGVAMIFCRLRIIPRYLPLNDAGPQSSSCFLTIVRGILNFDSSESLAFAWWGADHLEFVIFNYMSWFSVSASNPELISIACDLVESRRCPTTRNAGSLFEFWNSNKGKDVATGFLLVWRDWFWNHWFSNFKGFLIFRLKEAVSSESISSSGCELWKIK